MATRKIVPRADNEGGLGTALKRWASAFIALITCTTINALTLAAASVGFTIAGGTTSKTLTVDETVAMSAKAPKESPTFTTKITTPIIDLTGGQVAFPATQAPSAGVNTLDDYEEGTWVPEFTDLTVVNGTGGATYSGNYTKIGRLVFVAAAIAVTGNCTTASTENLTRITNLPFVVAKQSPCGVSDGNIANIGVGIAYTGPTLWTPTWSARNTGIFISAIYETT